jgi:ABC-type uncharacterized transport system substrate-binding protein
MPDLARAMVGGNPDAIIAVSDISIGALKAGSNSVPIVMSFGTGDPAAAGFASSITRPCHDWSIRDGRAGGRDVQ